MIKEFVDRYMEKKDDLRKIFVEKHPEDYMDIVKAVVTILNDDSYESIDPERINEIDYSNYQGTLLFVIASNDSSPSDFWFVKISYGSCSGCDTLQSIKYDNWDFDRPPTDKQIDDYMTLALHIVQGLKEMDGDEV
jgi:hypothetical protein